MKTLRTALLAIGVFGAPPTAALATTTYTYDSLGRLVRVDDGAGNYTVYHYDAAGNRSSLSSSGGNSAPTAYNDAITLNEDASLVFDPRYNDLEPDFDPLTISAKTNGAHGTVTIGGGSTTLTYAPTSGYYGSDSFTYTISDGNGHTSTATVTATVVNRPPTAVADTATTDKNTAVTFNPRTNDTDPDGDTLTITAKTDGAHGSVTINSGTSLTYTPATGYVGADSFTYTISDGASHTATATVSVTVIGVPVAVNDDWVIDAYWYGSPITPEADKYDATANDTAPPGDTISITSNTAPSFGSVSIVSGHLHFSANSSYNSAYSTSGTMTYTISDTHGHTSTATITVYLTIIDNR